MSLARTAKRKWKAVDPVLRALIISVLVHLTIFGSWKLGEGIGISQKLPLFNLIKKVEQKLLPVQAVVVAPPREREIQLTFVHVDPPPVEKEPNKAEPKIQKIEKGSSYYGAATTIAANPDTQKDTAIPKVDGTQKEVLKLTEDIRVEPEVLRPTPPSEPAQAEAKFKESNVPGDLKLAQPQEKATKGTGSPDIEIKQELPVRKQRPRTIAEARAAKSPGTQFKQDGGVKRHDLSASFNVKGTVIGGYDQRLIDAVQQSWDDSLEQVSAGKRGMVRLEFRINYKGQISDMRVAETTVTEMQTLLCQQAVLKPAPYGDWPREMRIELQHDYRDVTITFYYH